MIENKSPEALKDRRERVLVVTRQICRIECQISELQEKLDRLINELDVELHPANRGDRRAAKRLMHKMQKPIAKPGSVAARVLMLLRENGGKMTTTKLIDGVNNNGHPVPPKHVRSALTYLKHSGHVTNPERGEWQITETAQESMKQSQN